MNIIKELEAMYLDYANNFLTVEHFAKSHNITPEQAEQVINLGREFNLTY